MRVKRRGGERVSPSCSQPQASLSITLDYTLLPRKFHVHTLVYTARMFALLSPQNPVTVGNGLGVYPKMQYKRGCNGTEKAFHSQNSKCLMRRRGLSAGTSWCVVCGDSRPSSKGMCEVITNANMEQKQAHQSQTMTSSVKEK